MIYTAVIGLGIGQKHVEAIHKYKNFRVKYIYDFNQKKMQLIKNKYPDILIAKNENQIFLDNDVSLVSIASYDNYHFEQIKKSIKYKKHIIVEKPMCLTIRELELIKNLLKKNKKIQMLSNLVLTTNSLFKYFKSKIEKKNIFYIEADYIWGRKQKLFEWRSLIKKYSLTLGAGIHMIHLIMWLLDSKPQYVQGFINNKITKNTKYKKESFVLAILKFPKDILVKVTANAAGLFKHYHEIKIFGKNQTLSNSLMGSYSFEKKNKTNKFKILKQAYPDKKNRKNLIRNFINSIFVKRQKFDQSLNSQLDLMNICFSIDKSIRVNKMIKVKYK